MGYCMTQTDSRFFIESSKQDEAFEAVKKLMEKDEDSQFSWVNTKTVLKAQNFRDALAEWRYYVEFDEKYDIVDIQFSGDKLGDEHLMFDAIAPYVKDGSYIQMCGEEGDVWRWTFNNGECKEIEANFTFE